MLHTGNDHLGNDRTAVCCLSSVNAETFLEWRDHPMFIEDIMRFLDNVLQDFIDRAPDAAATAAYAAMRERSVGLGLMGFHSFLQSQNVPFESALAKSWNMRMFKHLRREADKASITIGEEKGPCPDAADRGVDGALLATSWPSPRPPRSRSSAAAPRAGIEPIPANIYTHKTLSGSFAVKNPYLEKLLEEKGQNTDADLGLDPGERGLGPAPGLPQPGRQGRLQDRLRAGPALGGRTGRRPHAGHLPVASR